MSIKLTEERLRIVRKVIFWSSLVMGIIMTSYFFMTWLIEEGPSWLLVGTWFLALVIVVASALAGTWLAMQILRRLYS